MHKLQLSRTRKHWRKLSRRKYLLLTKVLSHIAQEKFSELDALSAVVSGMLGALTTGPFDGAGICSECKQRF